MEPPISREKATRICPWPAKAVRPNHTAEPLSLQACKPLLLDSRQGTWAKSCWLQVGCICKAASVYRKRELRGDTPTQHIFFPCADGRSKKTNWPSVSSRNRQVHPSTRLCLSLHLIPARVAHTALPDTDYCCQPASHTTIQQYR